MPSALPTSEQTLDEEFAVVHERIGIAKLLTAAGLLVAPCFLMAKMQISESSDGFSPVHAGAVAANYEPARQKQRSAAVNPSSTVSPVQAEYRQIESSRGHRLIAANENSPSKENRRLATSRPPSEHRDVERFVSESVDQLETQQNNYNLELQSLGWNSILEPWHIEQDRTLAKSRAIIKQATTVVSKYEAMNATLIRDIRSRIYALPISDELKKELVARFDRCIIYARLGELWALRKQVVGRIAKIVDLLANSKRGVDWRVKDGQLDFASQSSVLTKFNSYVKDIDRIVEKQQRIREEGSAMSAKWLKEEKRRADTGK